MNFRQFYRCMCRNRSVSRVAVVCESELPVGTTDGGNACVLFARYGEGGTEVVGPIFFGE